MQRTGVLTDARRATEQCGRSDGNRELQKLLRVGAPHDRRPRAGRPGRQLGHVVNARGVYNAALVTGKVDWTQRHYTGPLTREALLEALEGKQREFLTILDTFDTSSSIDFGGTVLPFDSFACEMVHHEAIHHGQWSVYASLAGFETPLSWRTAWKM